MAKEQSKQSSAPMIIIAVVLIVAAGLGYWLYNSSSKKTTTKTSNTNTAKANNDSAIPANAPPGAQPPNIAGSPTASVTVEEFADFQCPSCGQMHPIMNQIKSIYGPRIKFIFRNYPLPMHDKAYDAAVAAEAAGLQGQDKFWAMQNQLYSNQQSWSSDPNYKQVFKSYAEKIGLDVDKWQTDMAGLQAKKRVDDDMTRARAINVASTPTVFINNKMVPYPDLNLQTMRQLIDGELAKASSQQNQPAAPASTPEAANSASNK
jgi:protein-disulfide isomerase